jgi:hypothetical protein
MPKAIKPPIRENYIECETCSEEKGETILWHRTALEKRTGFWDGEESTYCPAGHPIKT